MRRLNGVCVCVCKQTPPAEPIPSEKHMLNRHAEQPAHISSQALICSVTSSIVTSSPQRLSFGHPFVSLSVSSPHLLLPDAEAAAAAASLRIAGKERGVIDSLSWDSQKAQMRWSRAYVGEGMGRRDGQD